MKKLVFLGILVTLAALISAGEVTACTEPAIGPLDTIPTVCTIKVLLVDFADGPYHKTDPYPYTKIEFEQMLFSQDYYNTDENDVTSPDGEKVFGSMRDYYHAMSYGAVELQGLVVNKMLENGNSVYPDWITINRNKLPFSAWAVMTEGIAAAEEESLDVATDESCKLCVIYAGEYVGMDWSIPAENVYTVSETYCTGADNDTAKFNHIGAHCHEFAHLFGVDHCGYGHNWDVMQGGLEQQQYMGLRNGPKKKGACPAPHNPWSRQSCRVNINEITSNIFGKEIICTNDVFDVYKCYLGTSYDSIGTVWYEEYYVVENRQIRTDDFTRHLPGGGGAGEMDSIRGGLLIFHVQEFLDQSYIVNLLVADGDPDTSEESQKRDIFPGPDLLYRNLDDDGDEQQPANSRCANGERSFFAVRNISDPCDNMQVDLYACFNDIDTSGSMDIQDVLLILNNILGVTELTEDQQKIADINGDGPPVNVIDALGIVNAFLYGICPSTEGASESIVVTCADEGNGKYKLYTSNITTAIGGYQVHFTHNSTISEIFGTERTYHLPLDSNDVSVDSLIVVQYDENASVGIVTGKGPILELNFTGEPDLVLDDMVFTTLNGEEIDVEINHQPNTPSNPTPADGATDQSVDVDLSWSGGDPDTGNTVTYDFYLGISSPPPLADSNLTTSSYDPGPLDNGCTYYWQIVARDNHEVPTYGPEWTFSTPPNTVDLYPTKDAYIIAHPAYQTYNTGARTKIGIGRNSAYPDYIYRCLMEFDLSGIPSGAVIDEASLHMFVLANTRCLHTTELNIFRMVHSWDEGDGDFYPSENGATWLTSDGWTDWLGGPGAAGPGDCEQTAIGAVTIPYLAGIGQEITIPMDGAALEQMLEGGSFGNYGFLIKDTDEYQDNYAYHSSESSDSPSWPRLEIIYSGCGDSGDPPENSPPSITITNPPSGGATADDSYTITWTSEDPDTDVCTVDLYYDENTLAGGEIQIVLNTADDGSYTWNIPDTLEGSYYIYGVIDDGNGGTDSDYSAGMVTIEHDTSSCRPQISELNPNSGEVGSTVWIFGNHFGENQGSSEVTFYQEKTASISFWSDTQIKCAVPQGADDGYVTMTTDCGTSDGVNFDVTTGGDPGCPYVSPWIGDGYAVGNNILAASEDTLRSELNVVDYFRLEQPCVEKDERYWLQISEFEQEHTWLDEITLKTVDHPQGLNLGVTDKGELFLYTREVQPVSCVDSGEVDQLGLINTIDEGDYEGFPDDWLTVDFGHVGNPQNMYVEIMADLYPPKDQTIVLQLRGDHEWDWHDIALLHPRQHWATHLVDLSPHIESEPQDIAIRLYWLAQHKVDYICLAQSVPGPIVENECLLESAVHSVAGVVTDSLLTADEKYAELVPGENIEASFIPTELTGGFKRDFVMVATGHYVTEEGGAPAKVAMEIPSQLPTEFSLAQNYPNPFNPETEITFALPEASKVRLTIYNILGQVIEMLIDSEMQAGYHSVVWNGKSVASGIYFYRITAGDYSNTKRMLLLK